MLNIVLLAINAKYVHSSLAVWVIAEGIAVNSQFSHNVNIVEATINQKPSEIIDSVIKYKPDIIGVSSYIWNAAIIPELLCLLKKRLPDVTIVLGGPEASNNIDHWLKNGADHVLPGEGEYVFPKFSDDLVSAKLKYSGHTGHKKEQKKDFCSKSNLINPYTKEYLSALNGRLSYIETSRGCPFKCAYCLSAGDGVRFFPLDEIKDQIKILSQSSARTIKFVDRTFNCNAERAYEIFRSIISLDTVCTFHFEVAADLFDDRMMSVLETAPPGRIQFEIGLQSFHEPTLEAVSRKTDTDRAQKNILALIKMQNIHIHIDLIAGLPYETLDGFMNGFDRAYDLGAHHLQLGFLKLLHGSVLREKAKDFGILFSPDPPYQFISSPWLSEEDVQILKHAENSLQHTYNKSRFLSALHYVLTVTGLRPFSLMYLLGATVPNHGTQLENYLMQIYEFFLSLPGIEKSALQDCLSYDWLTMVKGKNAPSFMKNNLRKQSSQAAEDFLDRKLKREEFIVLNSGIGIFVNSNERNPLTGLYKVYLCE